MKVHYDFIIIGSGAGGSAAAYRLANAGKQVLLVEKGKDLPKDGSTLDFQKVINEAVFKSKEPWLDKQGKPFVPEEYFNLGGKTKWYGAALLRFDPSEFDADSEFQCLPWPIKYDELAPYYEEVEKLLGVHTFPIEPDLEILRDKIDQQTSGWRSEPLPLALDAAILQNENEARHFDGFASTQGLKADGQTSLLTRVSGKDNLTLVTGHAVLHLLGSDADPSEIAGVMLDNGQCFTADNILLGAGAMHSPRLLQDYFDISGLSATLPNAKLVGRYFKRHILTALLSFSSSRKTDALRKTTAWFNDRFPHSSIQPLGFSEDVLSTLIPRFVPLFIANWLGKRAYGFFLQTEDGSHPDNKVSAANMQTKADLPTLDYDLGRIRNAKKEHSKMTHSFQRALWEAGCISFTKPIPLAGTAHACGTLVAGNDPETSVVDRNGKVHGMANLYVVDGSILPRSSRVNPALTIYAWSLRVADQLLQSSITLTRGSAS
jgi:choline dehydrogenase-like flavoprotein